MGWILHSNVARSNIVHHISSEMQASLIKNILEYMWHKKLNVAAMLLI